MRIASLLPSATEIVCALGLEHDLVAVTHECDYPASVRAKPVLTRSVLAPAGSGVEVDRHIRELVHEGSSIYALDAGRLAALGSNSVDSVRPAREAKSPFASSMQSYDRTSCSPLSSGMLSASAS